MKCFLANNAKILRTAILKIICERLLLVFDSTTLSSTPKYFISDPSDLVEFFIKVRESIEGFCLLKSTVMQIEKALMNDRLHVSKVS